MVRRVEGNTLHLACAGLQHGYATADRTQVVRVPQFNNLTIENGAIIQARPWDGQRGGVVVVHVNGVTTLEGSISTSGQGFRGGAVENLSRAVPAQVTLYRWVIHRTEPRRARASSALPPSMTPWADAMAGVLRPTAAAAATATTRAAAAVPTATTAGPGVARAS